MVIRPCDANETLAAWLVALELRDRPVALVLTRQDVPTLDRTLFASAEGLRRGAYILSDAPDGKPDLILIATGSEVSLILSAQQKLVKEHNVHARVASMPSWELFERESFEYRNSIIPKSVSARMAVEAASAQGWRRFVGDQGDVIGIDGFGSSAPGEVVMGEYGFTVENVCERALELLERRKASEKS